MSINSSPQKTDLNIPSFECGLDLVARSQATAHGRSDGRDFRDSPAPRRHCSSLFALASHLLQCHKDIQAPSWTAHLAMEGGHAPTTGEELRSQQQPRVCPLDSRRASPSQVFGCLKLLLTSNQNLCTEQSPRQNCPAKSLPNS